MPVAQKATPGPAAFGRWTDIRILITSGCNHGAGSCHARHAVPREGTAGS